MPNKTSFFNLSLCQNSIFNTSLNLFSTSPGPASKYPDVKQLADKLNSAFGLLTEIVGELLKLFIPKLGIALYFR